MKKKTLTQDTKRDITLSHRRRSGGKMQTLVMTEYHQEKGLATKTQKKHSYFISEVKRGSESLKKPIITSKKDALHLRPHHINIQRHSDPKQKKQQTTLRSTGSFYFSKNQRMYAVAFLQSIQIDILKSKHLPTQ